MYSKTTTILAFASVAVAHPQFNKHHHFHGTASGGWGYPMPSSTGSPFPINGTMPGSNSSDTGAGSASVPVLSVTVQPIPAASSVADVAFSSPAGAGFGQVAASNTAVAPEMGASSTCTDSSTTTTTMTSIEYVTVTAGDGSAAASVTSAAGDAINPAASSVSLSSTASVSGGAFFNYPSHSAGGWGGFSSAAAASSTPAVSFGGVSSAAASAIPTTFATMSSAMGSAAASSAWPASSSTASTGGTTTSGKRGLSYNSASVLSDFSSMSWAYNWGDSASGTVPSSMEYVPMCWGLSSTGSFAAAASSAIASGSKHVLSFNEPDLAAQSNIDPATAAKNHIQYLNPFSGSAEIGSPAVTNGAGSSPAMGTTWLSQFFTACAGQCKVDFVAYHWYGDASNVADLQKHTQDVISTAAANGVSKVWLTEFGASGSDADVSSFLSSAMEYLDGQEAVERYAYFMASDGILVSGNGLSALGDVYQG